MEFKEFIKDIKEEKINEAYVKSAGFKSADKSIYSLYRALNPKSNLCLGLIKGVGDKAMVEQEFKEMHKHIDAIMSIWKNLEHTIDQK